MNWKKSRIIMSLMMLLILAGIGRIVYVDATAAKDKVVLLKSTTTADMIKTTESASEPEVTAVPATAAPEVTQTVTTVAPEVTQNVTTTLPDTTQAASTVIPEETQDVVSTPLPKKKGKEINAVWIYFDEMYQKAKTYTTWRNYIDRTFDTCKKKKMNTVILQVRPFADAMYPSKYYPWSRYATGTAGKNPGFDPLKYAVSAAHKRGLYIQAWVNPYRISSSSSSISKLPKSSIAYKWRKSKSASVRRRVLKLGNGLYFNPSSAQVQKLVANGVKELVANYAIDGVHMDDYFYPELTKANYRKFDYKEYKAYKKKCRQKKIKACSLVNWRRENVNKMVRGVYSVVKKTRKRCLFGISPAGNIENLYSKTAYYSPVKTWMNSDRYIDYVVPQIYWSFTRKGSPYKKVVNEWTSIPKSNHVSLYIGLAGYRAGISKKEAKVMQDPGWAKSNTMLKRQVEYARKTNKVDGFYLFSYETLTRSSAKKEVKNLLKVLK